MLPQLQTVGSSNGRAKRSIRESKQDTIEFIFEDPELPVRSDNPAVAVEQRHGWLIPPEWEFQSEVWEYERKSIDGDRREDSGTF